MKSFYRYLTLLAGIMFVFAACSKKPVEPDPGKPDNPSEPGDTTEVVTDFDIQITEITTKSAKFKITPKDPDLTYVYLARETSLVGEMTDEELIEMDLEYFDVTAMQNGVDVTEYLEKILSRGVVESESGMVFQPGTEYCFYCFGLTKYKEITTEVTRKIFKTEDPQLTDCTFETNTKTDGCRVYIDIIPSDKNQIYWEGVAQESLVQMQYQGDVSKVISGDIGAFISYAEMLGIDPEKILSSLWLQGDLQVAHFDLVGNSNYISYVAAIDKKGNVISEIKTSMFATTETTPSKVQFSVNLGRVTYATAEANVVPTQIDPYVAMILPSSELEGMSETAVMNYIIDSYVIYDQLKSMVYQGQKTVSAEKLIPDTEYSLCVFGYETVPTTELNRTDFKTKPTANPDDVTFEFTASNLLDRSAKLKVVASDESVTYLGGMISEAEYAAAATPTDAVKALVEAEIAAEIKYGKFADKAAYIAKKGINGTMESDIIALAPATVYYPFAICVTKAGEFVSEARFGEKVTTEAASKSDAAIEITYTKHFNGDQVADQNYSFDKARGRALVPVTLKPAVGTAHSYFLVIDGDASSMSDDELIAMIWKYGVEDYARINATAPWNAPVTFLAIGMDADGYIGAVTKTVTSFTKPKASPVSEFDFQSAPFASMRKPEARISSVMDGNAMFHVAAPEAVRKPAAIQYDVRMAERASLMRKVLN